MYETEDVVEISSSKNFSWDTFPVMSVSFQVIKLVTIFKMWRLTMSKKGTMKNKNMMNLIYYIQADFPDTKDTLEIHKFG